MPKTVGMRNLDDQVYAALQRLAADERITVPALLRRQAMRLAINSPAAPRASMREWLDRVSRSPRLDMSDEDINILDEPELHG